MTYGEIITEFEHQFPKFNYNDCRPYYPVENSLIFWNKGGEIAVTYKNGRFELIPNHVEYLSQEFCDMIRNERGGQEKWTVK